MKAEIHSKYLCTSVYILSVWSMQYIFWNKTLIGAAKYLSWRNVQSFTSVTSLQFGCVSLYFEITENISYESEIKPHSYKVSSNESCSLDIYNVNYNHIRNYKYNWRNWHWRQFCWQVQDLLFFIILKFNF